MYLHIILTINKGNSIKRNHFPEFNKFSKYIVSVIAIQTRITNHHLP